MIDMLSDDTKFSIYNAWCMVVGAEYFKCGYTTIKEFQNSELDTLAKENNMGLLEFWFDNALRSFSTDDDVYWIDDYMRIKSGSYNKFLEEHKQYFDVKMNNIIDLCVQNKDFRDSIYDILECAEKECY